MTPADSAAPATLTPTSARSAAPSARPTVAPARLTEKPTWLISQVSTQAHRLLAEKLAVVGARGYHYRLLAALEEFGRPARRASAAAPPWIAATWWQRSTSWPATAGAASPDPADHRRNVITITPVGTAHLQRLDGLLTDIQDELLAPLSPGERDQLTRLLSRVLQYHSTA